MSNVLPKLSAIFVAVGLFAAAGNAAAYEPFTSVKNVCPECTQPKADVVSLSDGTKVRGEVVAENSDYYIVLRYSELRAIPRNEVQGIEWTDGSKPSGLMNHDQLILKNGVVLTGSITNDKKKPALFQLKSSWADFTYIVFKDQVETAYKGGTQHTFDM